MFHIAIEINHCNSTDDHIDKFTEKHPSAALVALKKCKKHKIEDWYFLLAYAGTSILAGLPTSATGVQKFDDSRVLQFVLRFAVCYVLHRCESRVIHRYALCVFGFVLVLFSFIYWVRHVIWVVRMYHMIKVWFFKKLSGITAGQRQTRRFVISWFFKRGEGLRLNNNDWICEHIVSQNTIYISVLKTGCSF